MWQWCHFLLSRRFPDRDGCIHCRWILYFWPLYYSCANPLCSLSSLRLPIHFMSRQSLCIEFSGRILMVAMPSSSVSSWLRGLNPCLLWLYHCTQQATAAEPPESHKYLWAVIQDGMAYGKGYSRVDSQARPIWTFEMDTSSEWQDRTNQTII